MQSLKHSIFETLNKFSVELYLGHIDMSYILQFVPGEILGWGRIWTYDLLVLCVYAMCYLLHVMIHRGGEICSRFLQQRAYTVAANSP